MKRKVENHFSSVAQADVPHTRNGKHHQLIRQVLDDLSRLGPDRALKIPLEEVSGSKEHIRSALNRATHKAGIEVATSSDGEFLYVWRLDRKVV